jgi:hypothetical protein
MPTSAGPGVGLASARRDEPPEDRDDPPDRDESSERGDSSERDDPPERDPGDRCEAPDEDVREKFSAMGALRDARNRQTANAPAPLHYKDARPTYNAVGGGSPRDRYYGNGAIIQRTPNL